MGVNWIGKSEALQYISERTLRRWAKERGLTVKHQRVGHEVVTVVDGDQFYYLLDTVVPGRNLNT